MKSTLRKLLALAVVLVPLTSGQSGCKHDGETTHAQQSCLQRYQGQINASNFQYFQQLCRQQTD